MSYFSLCGVRACWLTILHQNSPITWCLWTTKSSAHWGKNTTSMLVFYFVSITAGCVFLHRCFHNYILDSSQSQTCFCLTDQRWLTCGRQQSTRDTLRCDCRKGKGCLLPYTAHTRILWPDNATYTHKHIQNESESQGFTEVIRLVLL